MQHELLLIAEMIDAGAEAHRLVRGTDLETLGGDRQRRDALLWNSRSGRVSGPSHDEVKSRFPQVPWEQPSRLRNRIVHGYWSIDLEILHTTPTDALPALVSQLRQVLAMLEAEHVEG